MRTFAYRITLFLCFVVLFFSLSNIVLATEEAGRWTGVDELVIERFAKEYGRESREPFINTDQGDLLLFVFLLAGSVGGFVAGYYWKELTQKNYKTTGGDKTTV
jgi:ABC-type cobalt transport system substrate-binding protein